MYKIVTLQKVFLIWFQSQEYFMVFLQYLNKIHISQKSKRGMTYITVVI